MRTCQCNVQLSQQNRQLQSDLDAAQAQLAGVPPRADPFCLHGGAGVGAAHGPPHALKPGGTRAVKGAGPGRGRPKLGAGGRGRGRRGQETLGGEREDKRRRGQRVDYLAMELGPELNEGGGGVAK